MISVSREKKGKREAPREHERKKCFGQPVKEERRRGKNAVFNA